MSHTRNPERLVGLLSVLYVPVLAAAVILSYRYRVGARPGRSPNDVFLRGTPYAPPLFLPAALLTAKATADRQDLVGGVGKGVVGLVGVAFLLGSTLNLPNDLEAARAANAPVAISSSMAVFHALFGMALAGQTIVRFRRPRNEPGNS